VLLAQRTPQTLHPLLKALKTTMALDANQIISPKLNLGFATWWGHERRKQYLSQKPAVHIDISQRYSACNRFKPTRAGTTDATDTTAIIHGSVMVVGCPKGLVGLVKEGVRQVEIDVLPMTP